MSSYRGNAPRGRGGRGRGDSRGGRGSTPFGRGGASTFPQQQYNNNANTIVFDILNLPADIQYNELNQCVNTHTTQGFRYVKLTLHGNQAKLIINSNDIQKIQNLNNAQVRPGIAIQLQQSTQSQPHVRPVSQQQRDTLKQLIQQRYDANTHTLSMSATHSPENDYNNKSFVYALLDCITELCPNLITLDLSNNNITQLQSFSKLGYITPALVNLSLANNQINALEQLEQLGSSDLSSHIQQLMLQNNPIVTTIQQQYNDSTVYQYLIQTIFTQLTTLDGQPVQQLIQFDVPNVPNTLPATQTSYFDSDKTQSIVGEFVNKYYTIYDTSQQERQKLLSVYNENAVFTLSTNSNDTTVPTEYSTRSHNIYSMTGINKTQQSIQTYNKGHIAIVYSLSQLPATQHDISNFTADVSSISTLGGSIVCILKGQYLENNTELRQFHRTFILCAPSNEALRKQWNVSIMHDMLYIGSSQPFQIQQQVQQQQMQPNGQQQAEAFFSM